MHRLRIYRWKWDVAFHSCCCSCQVVWAQEKDVCQPQGWGTTGNQRPSEKFIVSTTNSPMFPCDIFHWEAEQKCKPLWKDCPWCTTPIISTVKGAQICSFWYFYNKDCIRWEVIKLWIWLKSRWKAIYLQLQEEVLLVFQQQQTAAGGNFILSIQYSYDTSHKRNPVSVLIILKLSGSESYPGLEGGVGKKLISLSQQRKPRI